MRKALVALLGVCLLAFVFAPVSARDALNNGTRINRDGELPVTDPGLVTMYNASDVDTFCIVWFNFEPNTWQGWDRVDNTAQIGTWFHVDDFNGITPGYAGRLVAIEGTQSAWCGARPTDGPYEYLCSWERAPGYGNSWNQSLLTGEIVFAGILHLSYHGVFDSEPDWDYTYVEYDAGNDNWVRFQSWDGVVDTIITHDIPMTKNKTKLRFNFVSDGAWSDQDGLWQTDGACVVDSITIADDSTPDPVLDFEDFEDWTLYATDNFAGGDIWYCAENPAYGRFSGLASNLDDKDPCGDNFGTQIVFYIGSTFPSASYPGLFDTPFCTGPGNITAPCQDESIVSPVIQMDQYSTNCDVNQDGTIPAEDLPLLGGAIMRFTAYRDIPLPNLVFYTWGLRNIDPITGCPGQWQDRNFVYYGPDKDYIFGGWDVSDLIGPDPIQMRIGVSDMCDAWYDSYGDCAAHTPTPWLDNARIYRYKVTGPQWAWRDLDIFQDNFPGVEFDLESWVRADAANDLNGNDDPIIRPGDSSVVDCTSPLAGALRNGGVTGEAEVYCHVRATDIGPLGKPALFGSGLVGTYGTYVSDDGEWTIIQCDSALSGGVNTVADKFMIDLNDSLFTRGYMVEYYFLAWDANGYSSTLPRRADEGQYFEFTCLPTGKSDVLFVDDFHGRGTFEGNVETYWNPTFAAVIPPENQPDRYDVNSPSSLVSNGPGSRAYLNQLRRNEGSQSGYTIIVWDSGNLSSGTITDGSTLSDKSDDATMLINWLDQSENDVGLFVCGDDVAEDLNGLPSTQALQLMSTWCGVNFIEGSYFDLTGGRMAGGVVTPLCAGTVGGIFGSGLGFYAFAGCPIINQFDVLDATANGNVAVLYPDYEGDSYAAGIQSVTVNASGYDAKTMWFGFSFMYLRDTDVASPGIRNVVFNDIYVWFNGIPNTDITEDEVPKANKLSQNFPNPFNPTTTIKFDVRAKGHVSLKIYNVAGQLVKTMANEVMDAGSYSREWTGTNNAGVKVASGVYFYSFEAENFKATKKMVLLR